MSQMMTTIEVDQFAAARAGDFRHPASILARLGIEYEYEAEADQGDVVVFHHCINIPAALPVYVTAHR